MKTYPKLSFLCLGQVLLFFILVSLGPIKIQAQKNKKDIEPVIPSGPTVDIFSGLQQKSSDSFQINALWLDKKNIEFTVNALAYKSPDEYRLVFELHQLGKTVEESVVQAQDRFAAFLNELSADIVRKDKVAIEFVSLHPIYAKEKNLRNYSRKTYRENPKWYETVHNIQILFSDPNQTAKIIALASKYEIMDLIQLDYLMKSPEDTYQELRKKCIEHYVKQISTYEQLGVELDVAPRIVSESKLALSPNENRTATSYPFRYSSDFTSAGILENANLISSSHHNAADFSDIDLIVNQPGPGPQFHLIFQMKVLFMMK
jgi:uncharacterized protein YggE